MSARPASVAAVEAAPAAAALLDVNGIEVVYHHVILVLKGVSLRVPEGAVVALLGGNGAGSTPTTVTPAHGSCPPGTVSSKGNEPAPATIASPSNAASVRSNGSTRANSTFSSGVQPSSKGSRSTDSKRPATKERAPRRKVVSLLESFAMDRRPRIDGMAMIIAILYK